MDVHTYVCMYACMYYNFVKQGRSQEFSFTEARLKGKGASNAGVWAAHGPEAHAIHQSNS